LAALSLIAGLALCAPMVAAEDVEKPAKHRKKPRKKRAASKPDKQEAPLKADKTAIAAAQAAAPSNAQIVKEGDTSVKVMSFEGLGIEGRLKSPQLVYFVQRVQAEFARPVLPHRSFMPELQDTTAREPVR
jgi:hypothetical protein